MLKKQMNIKGLRKKVLKLEYENKLTKTNKQALTSTKNIKITKGAILILRNAPIDESLLKQLKQKLDLEIKAEDSLLNENSKKELCLLNKCIKKNILKKVILPTTDSKKVEFEKTWLQCKYIYWLAPDALNLKEQLLHLNLLKAYIKAEPKEAFLGCLLESNFVSKANLSFDLLDQKKSQHTESIKEYRYYYPSQILSLCDSVTMENTKFAGLESLSYLLQTIEMSINSMSMLLALKKQNLSIKE